MSIFRKFNATLYVPMTLAAAFALFACPSAQAAIENHGLGLSLGGADIVASGVNIEWKNIIRTGNIVTGQLLVTGRANSMDIDDVPPAQDYRIFPTAVRTGFLGGFYNINISVRVDLDHDSIEATGGTLAINGYLKDVTVPDIHAVDGTGVLLTGSVADFGFTPIDNGSGNPSPGRGVFEFVFQPTGGDLAQPHPEFGSSPLFAGAIGVIYSSSSLHNTSGNLLLLSLDSFITQFSSNSGSSLDTSMVVPEPSSLPILSGLVATFLITALGRRKRLPHSPNAT